MNGHNLPPCHKPAGLLDKTVVPDYKSGDRNLDRIGRRMLFVV
jgi:hypothetical protein